MKTSRNSGVPAPIRLTERSLPGTVTHSTHVQMFNVLAGTEAGGNATFTPHPGTPDQPGHFTEVTLTEATVEYVCKQPVFTRKCATRTNTRTRFSDDAVYARSQVLYQRFFSVAHTHTQARAHKQ